MAPPPSPRPDPPPLPPLTGSLLLPAMADLRRGSYSLLVVAAWAAFTWAWDGPAACLVTKLARLSYFQEEEVRYTYEIGPIEPVRVVGAFVVFTLLRAVLLPMVVGPDERAEYDTPRRIAA
jgi:hypothetical protein